MTQYSDIQTFSTSDTDALIHDGEDMPRPGLWCVALMVEERKDITDGTQIYTVRVGYWDRGRGSFIAATPG
jgi:hypothetical protein